MRISKSGNIEPKEFLNNNDVDFFITSSGYESRATNLLSQYDYSNSVNYVIGFENNSDKFSRKYNDFLFRKAKFIYYTENESKSDIVVKIVEEIRKSSENKEKVTILVDYSCMSRVWYAKLLELITYAENISSNLRVVFSYSPSKFNKAPDLPAINKKVEPISGFSKLSVPDAPTAIVIGLGYISVRAFGLNEFLDAEPYVFYNDDTYNKEFTKEVEKNNKALLKQIKANHIFKFPLNDTAYTEIMLMQLCQDLVSDYRLILAPCGPKPFTLISLLVSLQVEGVDVWRVSAGESANAVDKISKNNELIMHYVDFE